MAGHAAASHDQRAAARKMPWTGSRTGQAASSAGIHQRARIPAMATIIQPAIAPARDRIDGCWLQTTSLMRLAYQVIRLRRREVARGLSHTGPEGRPGGACLRPAGADHRRVLARSAI